jgi:hypothetical protein
MSQSMRPNPKGQTQNEIRFSNLSTIWPKFRLNVSGLGLGLA